MASRSIAPNPYDYINEVSNPALFAGRREELDQLEEDVKQLAAGHVIAPMAAIVGERRIGKTSMSLRVQEFCETSQVLSLRVSLTDMTAVQPWEFWYELFYGLLSIAGGELKPPEPNLGFRPDVPEDKPRFGLTPADLEFFRAYGSRSASVPSNHLIHDGLKSLVDALIAADRHGILLILDEAHLLVTNHIITQQLRFAVRAAKRCGIIFVGEPELAQVFADRSQPLFAQGRVIPLDNFATQADIAECALLPLPEAERPLINPMTVDYLQIEPR